MVSAHSAGVRDICPPHEGLTFLLRIHKNLEYARSKYPVAQLAEKSFDEILFSFYTTYLVYTHQVRVSEGRCCCTDFTAADCRTAAKAAMFFCSCFVLLYVRRWSSRIRAILGPSASVAGAGTDPSSGGPRIFGFGGLSTFFGCISWVLRLLSLIHI